MDEISNRALLIGMGVFVTIIITSGVFYALNQMKVVYSQVYETNISLQDMFGEYEEYDNTTKTGIDILNTMKKYRNDSLVTITIDGSEQNKETYITNHSTEESQVNLGKELYDATVEINTNTSAVVISFTGK